MLTIDGHCDLRFAAVRETFFANFTERGDVGAAVCVYVDGVPVVDCWGGHADAARTRPFGADTIVSVASTTKGMVALCAHMLAERGKLDLDAPVARYWPEFARAGKPAIPGQGHAGNTPAANGHTSARGVPRVYAALARGGELDGVRLLAPATIDRAIEEQSRGGDAVLTLPTRFATGFMLGMPDGIFECGPGPRTFGHPGRGGSIGFADPDARLAFGYVTNQYVTGTAKHPDRRVRSLVDAVYAALR